MVTQITSTRAKIFSWGLYDWGNSAFSTIVVTFVYATYFARGIVGDADTGAAWWGYALGVSGFLIAFLSPLAGAIADYHGAPKRWLFSCTLACVFFTALLWTGIPAAPGAVIFSVLIFFILANTFFELAFNFYSAMLPSI